MSVFVFSVRVIDAFTENLPSGWSAATVTTGRARITHNLGVTNYAVVGDTQSGIGGIRVIFQTANEFEIECFNGATGAAGDNTAYCYVVLGAENPPIYAGQLNSSGGVIFRPAGWITQPVTAEHKKICKDFGIDITKLI